MTLFKHLCNHPIDEYTEHLETPHKDIAQETWLIYFEGLLDIPPVSTFDELVEAFSVDAPLINNIYRAQKAQHYRNVHGHKNSPNKSRLLQNTTVPEDFEDTNDYFTEIEDVDLVEGDPRLKELPESHKEAIKRFIAAFVLIEQGYKIPNALSKQISRDRKLTGLPLVLPTNRRNPSQ